MVTRTSRRVCAAVAALLGILTAQGISQAQGADVNPATLACSDLIQTADNPQSAPWHVAQLTGQARTRSAGQAFKPLRLGDKVAVGSEVVTGANSELVLERAKDRITLLGTSWVQLGPPKPGGLVDRFIQTIGTILFDVEPRDRSFGVETPFLVVVVKGTRFVVTVGTGASAVHVERGRVQVTSREAGESTIVEAGDTVRVGPREKRALTDPGEPSTRWGLSVSGTGTSDQSTVGEVNKSAKANKGSSKDNKAKGDKAGDGKSKGGKSKGNGD
jgi:FecR protein